MKKTILIITLVLTIFSSASAQSIEVEGLTEEDVNATYNDSGVNFNTSYLNKTVDYSKVIKPDNLSTKDGVQVKTKTEKENSTEVQFSFQVASNSNYTWLQGKKFSGKISIKDGEKKSNFINGTLDSDKDESIIIDAESHYEHLILNYNLTDAGVEQNTSENVYSGTDTERIPVSGDVRQNSAASVTQSITKDNLYEPETTEKLVVAHEPETNISSIDFKGLSHEEINIDYSEDVQSELDSVGVTQGSIDSPEDFEFTAYNVTYPAKSEKTIEINYSQPVYNPLTDNPENFNFEYYSYIIGSVATFKTDTGSEWNEGTFTQTKESNSFLNLEGDISTGDGFEDGNINEYDGDTGIFSITSSTSTEGSNSVFSDSVGDIERSSSTTTATSPSYFEVNMRQDDVDFNKMQFSLTDSSGNEFAFVQIDPSGQATSLNANNGVAVSDGEWVEFSLRNIDYSNNQYDLYVDGSLVEENVGFQVSASDIDVWKLQSGGEGINQYWDGIRKGYYSSGDYVSKVYSASEKKIWDNITISNFQKNSGSIDIWVKTSNDGFTNTLETEKISSSQLSSSGTQTVDLSLSEGAKDVKYNISYTKGTSSPSIDSIELDGKTANQAPSASFTSNSPVLTSEDFGLDASGSSDPDGDSLTYSWDFNNDGVYGDDAGSITPSNSEPDDGSYTIGLKVDDGSATDTVSNTVTVENRNPFASVSKNASNPLTSETVEFDGSGSSDQDGFISSYEWDLDNDGIYDEATGSTATKSFPDDGTKTVGLRVTDDDGATSTTSIDVSVQNRNPSADYSYSTSDKTLSVDGTGSSDQDGSISSYEWDWTNDGVYDSTGSTASHTYSTGGSYTVKLRVTDDDTATSTTTQTVSINKDPVITSQEIKIDNKNNIQRLLFGLDSQTESDITSFNGAGTQQTFTNTSLNLDIGLPLTSTYNVTDTESAVSNNVNIDLSTTDTGIKENTGYNHNLNTQEIEKNITISNNNAGSIDYNLIMQNFGTTIQGEQFTGTINGNTDVKETGVWSVDKLSNQTFDFTPSTNSVTLGVNYLGNRPLEIQNTASNKFTDVNTSKADNAPQGCTQSNNTLVDISASTTQNFSIQYSCNAGTIGNPVQTITSVNSLTDRVWYNSTDMQIKTNQTETTTIAIRADKDNLKSPNERDGGTLKGFVEGVSTENSQYLSIQDTGGFFRLEVEDGFQQSSLHTDDTDWSMTYVLNEEGTRATGGGGGGTEPSTDDLSVYFGSDETVDGVEKFNVDYGETNVKELSITNKKQEKLTAEISTGDTGICRYVSVRPSLSSTDSWSGSGTYELGAAEFNNLGTIQTETVRTEVRFDLPSKEKLETQGLASDLTCEFDTASSFGTAELLVADLQPEFSLLRVLQSLNLVEQSCFESDGVTASFTDGSVEKGDTICLPVPTPLGGGASVLAGLLGFVAYRETSA